MPAPLISVVLPVRNAAKTIERAIRSILKSSFKQIELIVIDDGSTDGSPEIINSIIDPRLHLFHQGQEGICAAANRGTAEAHAPIIARMVMPTIFLILLDSNWNSNISIKTI